MIKSQISDAFPIGHVKSMSKMDRGNTADTYKIETDKGYFIAKTIATLNDAEFEYRLHHHFREKGIANTPMIQVTVDQEFAALIEGTYYQLQTYIVSTSSIPSTATWVRSIVQLLKAFSTFEITNHERLDRFSLLDEWNRSFESWRNYSEREYEWLAQRVDELHHFDNWKSTWIHGDLGSWNTLYNDVDDQLVFIDFGEARMGHPYFDFAALLTSFSPHPKHKMLFYQYVTTVLKEYEKYDCPDYETLYQFIRLWLVRGIVAAGVTSSYWTHFKEAVIGYEDFFTRKGWLMY
ncbi:aminoglycoside phosphotransferase family protein [Sporosarcina sp. Te-1]|uniref:aminoglycoside phosphotransferase family protein n=1 Tax=Sporosarcina sp. Te-1 TaxID=2818390 RepID=UPI001A9FF6C4|nr:aminoglycoside phosphotransferase family protein [Sporosarcina sp. Te-1]QTD40189.1 aminoglycoside phosphotransferase family protein [Sporosarcina sp. Te-1]